MSAAAGPKKSKKAEFAEEMKKLIVELKKHLGESSPDAIDAIFKATPALDVWYRSKVSEEPLLYRLLGGEFYIDDGRVLYPRLSSAVSGYLMDLYHASFPTEDFTYVGDELRKPMLSQKGMTCVSDAFYTILFESEILKPFMASLRERIPAGVEMGAGLCAATTRYKRINFTQRGRRLSISNNLWKEGIMPLALDHDPEKGVVIAKLFHIFENIFAENIYEIEGLRAGAFVVEKIPRRAGETRIQPLTQSRFMKSFGFLVGFESMEWDPVSRKKHAIGFMKNGDTWHILDNDVGYIHVVQDNEWFANVFMPRLLYSVSTYSATSTALRRGEGIENIYKRVFAKRMPEMKDDLLMAFATLGDKSYPNSYDFRDLFAMPTRGSLWMPYEIVFIAHGDEGAGAGAGASGGYRRKTRRRPRRV